MFGLKSPIEYLKEMIHHICQDVADAAFSWLQTYMIQPTDFNEYGFVGQMFHWIFIFSVSIGILFFVYNLVKLMVQVMGGYANRGPQEIVVKTILGTMFAVFSPFLLKSVLFPINNAWVQFVVSKGVNVNTFTKFVQFPETASITFALAAVVLAVLFLVLAIQYIIRIGELMVLFIGAPIAAFSIVNEDMNIFPVWWREATSTVFQTIVSDRCPMAGLQHDRGCGQPQVINHGHRLDNHHH